MVVLLMDFGKENVKFQVFQFKFDTEKLYPLYCEAKKLEETFEKIVYQHIYRQYNSRADELANSALEDQEFFEEIKTGF